MPTEQTEQMKLGEAWHAQLEDYYRSAKPPVEPSILELLKRPEVPLRANGPPLLIEYPQDRELGISAAGIPIRGRIDLLVDRESRVDVWDWKTRSSLRYAKGEEELVREPQMVIYGKFATVRFNAPAVRYYHGNLWTKGVGATVVETDIQSAGAVQETFEDVVVPAVERILETAKAKRVEDVSPRTQSCNAFNRPCPFLDICPLSIAQLGYELPGNKTEDFSDSNDQPTMSLKEHFEAKRRASGINPPDAAKPDVPAPYTAQKPPGGDTAVVPAPTPVGNPLQSVAKAGVEGSAPAGTAPPLPGAASLTLILNATPTKGLPGVVLLSDELARRSKPILEAQARKHAGKMPADASDVRQVPYGEGVAELAASFVREPLRGVVVAHTGGLTSAVLDVIEAQASVVIRGG